MAMLLEKGNMLYIWEQGCVLDQARSGRALTVFSLIFSFKPSLLDYKVAIRTIKT